MVDQLAGFLDLPLVSLKLDPASNNVVLDQEPLQKVLQKLKDWMKDVTTRGFERLNEEIDMQVAGVRSDLTVAIAESVEVMDNRFASRSVVKEIEETAAQASERAFQVETKQTKLSERVNMAVEKAELAETRVAKLTRQIESGVIESGAFEHGGMDDGLLPVVGEHLEEGQKSAPARSSMSTSVTATAPAPRSTPGPRRPLGSGGGGGGGVNSAELDALKEHVEELKVSLSETKEKMDMLESRTDTDIEKMKERMERCESNGRERLREATAQGTRLDSLDASLQRLQAEVVDLARELREEKADKESVKALEEEVERLATQVEQACMIDSVEARVSGVEQRSGALERRAALLERASKEAAETQESMQYDISDSVDRLARCEQKAEELEHKADAQLARQRSYMDEQDQKAASRLDAVEVELISHTKLLAGMSDKASVNEVVSLKGALCSLAEGVKEKEQSVLFGARCLSCNRVFDDVQTEAGVVNPRLEKQKAQVLADIQRALHTPRTDPSQPIKMLAVKVGRPGGLAPYEGRDPSSLTWTAEDVSIMPVRSNFGGSDRPRDALPQAPAAARPVSGRPDPQAPDGRRGGDRSRGAAAGSALAAFRSGQKDGPMDFKHPLSHLVGRP